MALKWIIRLLAAGAMVGIIHAFMIRFAVPTPAAWVLGAVIYAGLISVLFSKKTIVDKVEIYLVFAVVTVVGSVTVCPCTGAHFFVAPIAGLLALGVIQWMKLLLPQRWLAAADGTEQKRGPGAAVWNNLNGKEIGGKRGNIEVQSGGDECECGPNFCARPNEGLSSR